MANTIFADQPSPLGVSYSDAVEAVVASYRAHRQNGDSELASHQAALSAYLDHVGRQQLGTAVNGRTDDYRASHGRIGADIKGLAPSPPLV